VICADGLARPPWAATDPLLRGYYDTKWGMPVTDERGLFEQISLEAFQAGLPWVTVLCKRPALRRAFDEFDPDAVAGYTGSDVERLLGEPAIIRNRRKILAVITNARATIRLRGQGGLAALAWSFKPEPTPRPATIAKIPVRSPESAALSRRCARTATCSPAWSPCSP